MMLFVAAVRLFCNFTLPIKFTDISNAHGFHGNN